LTPGRHEVERAGERSEPREQGQLELEAEVLLERRLGVHRHGPEPGRDLALAELGGGGLEGAGQVSLGVDLAQQRALPPRGRQRSQGRGDRRLADTALAGDEQQPAVEQVGGRVGRRHLAHWGHGVSGVH
jgi:hypothetical protein